MDDAPKIFVSLVELAAILRTHGWICIEPAQLTPAETLLRVGYQHARAHQVELERR